MPGHEPDEEDWIGNADDLPTGAEGEGVLDAPGTLEGDPGDDPLDAGVIPPDRWSRGGRYGTTLSEEEAGESLDQHLAEEQPDVDPYAEAGREAGAARQAEDDEDADEFLSEGPRDAGCAGRGPLPAPAGSPPASGRAGQVVATSSSSPFAVRRPSARPAK